MSQNTFRKNACAQLRSPRRSLRLEALEHRQLLAVDLSFGEPLVYPTIEQPNGLDVADFDGDGHLDIAVANTEASSVSFLKGLPNGSFQRLWQDVAVRSRPLAVAAGDLDGDGNIDVVTANEGSHLVAILYGEGDGEFRRRNIRLSGLHESIALSDLNKDGRLDILVTTSGIVTQSGATNLEPGVHVIYSATDPLDLDGFERPRKAFSAQMRQSKLSPVILTPMIRSTLSSPMKPLLVSVKTMSRFCEATALELSIFPI